MESHGSDYIQVLKYIYMHIVKVKRNGRTDIKETIKYHTAPRVNKSKRKSLRTIKEEAQRRRRDARLLKALAK